MSNQRRKEFGAYLARLRGKTSQQALAARLCELSGTDTITRNEVSRWERGIRVPHAWLPFLAQALSVPPATLERAAQRTRPTQPTTTNDLPVNLSPLFPADSPLKTRIISAWHGRTVAGEGNEPVLVLVGGYAGSGKTEFARFMADMSGWAFLDKDTLTRRMTERLLTCMGTDPHDRHSTLYHNEVRPLEYQCLMDVARDNLDCGVSAILAAPFIAELNDESWLNRLTNRCNAKGIDVSAVWVHCDTESMREYIELRDAPRDTWKLANWDTYASTLNTHTSPPNVHLTVDNRLGAAISIADQTREALHKITT